MGYEKEQDERLRRKMARKKLYEVLRYYGFEKPKGVGSQSVLCPFHDDSHPSGLVNWDSGRFMCFACEVRGNAIDLVRISEHLGLDEAVTFILAL